MPLRKSLSFWTLVFCSVVVLLTSFVYYPKWGKPGSEAIISWDASGYYMYLPAAFIYHDLKQVSFLPEITRKYSPDPYQNQAHLDSLSGNQVLKYSAGLAVQVLPFFAVAHQTAKALDYEADGFSLPYQLGLQIGCETMAVLGLLLVWFALRRRFGEWPTALTLVVIVLGTNYLNYAAIDGAMTHNWLFTLYAALMLLTPAFYARPGVGRALAIGAVCGLMALTRPTEILAVLIPLLWGLRPARAVLMERVQFWRAHLGLLLLAAGALLAVGSLQPLYWHYVTGRWLVYSYGDQGFNWLQPNLRAGLIGYKGGWLVYTPLMLTALLGFGALRRQQSSAFWAILGYLLLFMYVTFAWNEFYGGIGARAMVQSYAVLAWPLAAAMGWVLQRRWRVAAYAVCLLLGISFNLWLMHQAHRGTVYIGEMNRPYFWAVLLRSGVPSSTRWLLDNSEQVLDDAKRKNVQELWRTDFEQAAPESCFTPALNGRCSLALDNEHQTSPQFRIPASPGEVKWVRARAQAKCVQKEFDMWKMTQMLVRFRRGDTTVKEGMIRLQRAVEEGWPSEVYLDVEAPQDEDFDSITVEFWNAGSPARILIDDLSVEKFER
ncbi:hypothetical protein LJ737_08985 [Hymenobacter sp. 15J16-1T3B]|uniref:hypothetical protein n=1 Tax=Hymenobacter sp. 15J16-1T3B TaxID=2886941 RepID=UPI001D10B9A3|nr:hypothetical protein [Hymenobacter sp. 15J16-1T3B]MCC3157373.1 hypothetical protein [Hymenobacter sp. 15J16-1T3B]